MNQHFGTTLERKETGAQLDLTKQQTSGLKYANSCFNSRLLGSQNFDAEQVAFSSLVTWRQDSNDSEMQRSTGQ